MLKRREELWRRSL